MLAGVGYFFSGAVTTIIGDFSRYGIVVFIIVIIGIISFYLLERFWLSKKVEEANPETILKLEEKIHDIEDRLHIPHRHEEKLEKEQQKREELDKISEK
jgi:hypothetical protein